MPKKIAFGTTLLNRGKNKGGIDGIGHYCQELLDRLESETSDFQIERYSFGERDIAHAASIYPKYTTHLIKGFMGLKTKNASNYDALKEADLIHSTDHLIPINVTKPLLASIMDVIPLSHPEFIQSRIAKAKALLWKRLNQQVNHIITISEFSKNAISDYLNYPLEQITAIPLGVDNRYFEAFSKLQKEEIKSKYGINRPYFLFIGSLQPRKNLPRLIDAHKNLPGNLSTDFPLVVVGRKFWDDGTTKAAMDKAISEKRCIWLNYVSDYEKRCLLQGALALCFVSLYEGFGLPILEAFASNTPVITSDCTSMPEVAGGCALLANPLDSDSIRNHLLAILENPQSIDLLKSQGFERAKLFNWDKVAYETKKVYEALL